jgi:hypothetical protein
MGLVPIDGLSKFKNVYEHAETENHDFTACSIAPQSLTLPCAPKYADLYAYRLET